MATDQPIEAPGAGTSPLQTVARIGKLLRHAERAATEAEREAFMARALLLAARHDVDLALARADVARQEHREEPAEHTIEIGRAGRRGLADDVRLYLGIARAFGVQCFIAHDSTRVYANGFPSDVAVVGMLYESLMVQLASATRAYLASGEHREHKVWVREASTGRLVHKRVHGSTARKDFRLGFVAEVSMRLKQAQEEARRQAEADQAAARRRAAAGALRAPDDEPDATVSVALALRSKELAVSEFHEARRREQGIRSTWRGGGRRKAVHAQSREAGREAGRRANLHLAGRRRGIDPPS